MISTAGIILSIAAAAGPTSPAMADDIGVTERLGGAVPFEAPFVDERGRPVCLEDLIRDGKPILLVLAYYGCPMLCGLVLQNVTRVLTELSWMPGREFRAVTISFDSGDSPATATARRGSVEASFGRGALDWSFWTGPEESVRVLLDALGVRVKRDEANGRIAHPAVFFVLTPEGRVSRYLYGTDVPARDVKLALLEAASGKIGSTIDRVLLHCYAYDPATRRYGLTVTRFMRAGAGVLLAALALLIGGLLRVEWKRAPGTTTRIRP